MLNGLRVIAPAKCVVYKDSILCFDRIHPMHHYDNLTLLLSDVTFNSVSDYVHPLQMFTSWFSCGRFVSSFAFHTIMTIIILIM